LEEHRDVTADGKIVGIELLDASRRFSIESLLTYEIEPETIRDLGSLHGDPLFLIAELGRFTFVDS